MSAEPRSFRPPMLGLGGYPVGPGERRRVLVVDDEPGIRYMARRVLGDRFEVREAASGEEALHLLESEPFQIAVVDVRLPGISGLDLLAALKTVSPSIDVIVITGSSVDLDEALEGAIRRRAFFFLRKPFPMSILETLAARVAEKQELEEQVQSYTQALETSLESARIFQRGLLPPSTWEGSRIRVASSYHPSEQLGGDFFDFWTLPDGGTALLIVDVEGHGATAAMITGIVKSQVHSLLQETREPGEVLSVLDAELSRISLPSFLTAFLLLDHPERGMLAYAGAGHPPGVLLAGPAATIGGKDDPRLLISAGIPINMGLPPFPRETGYLERIPGSRLLLFTDGYPEIVNQEGRAFDESEDPARAHPVLLAFSSPFGRSVLEALRADSPLAGLEALDSSRAKFGPMEALYDDDRAAVLAWFL